MERDPHGSTTDHLPLGTPFPGPCDQFWLRNVSEKKIKQDKRQAAMTRGLTSPSPSPCDWKSPFPLSGLFPAFIW